MAFVLHLLLAIILFVMSYPIFAGIYIFNISLNDIITSLLLLSILFAMLLGMLRAHQGKTLSF
jgi:hypothetical protein